MDITYDSLFVTNPAQYQTSPGTKLCTDHEKHIEVKVKAVNSRYLQHVYTLGAACQALNRHRPNNEHNMSENQSQKKVESGTMGTVEEVTHRYNCLC